MKIYKAIFKYQNKATYLHNIHEAVHERDQQVYGLMLGSVDQDIIQELSQDLWSIMMFYIAKCMYPLYKKSSQY
jgi:hypothetical protein